MEYQKHCQNTHSDPNKAHQTFLGTVASKFTPEAFHTLRRYMSTIDHKTGVALQLRAQKYTDAGTTMGQRALDMQGDPREKLAVLAVSQVSMTG